MTALSRLQPAPIGAGEWALHRMRGREGVALIVPDVFPAVVRIMHELTEDIGPDDGDYIERVVRWSDVLPAYLERGPSGYLDDEIAPYITMPGVLDRSIVDALIPLLHNATRTFDDSYFGLWSGHGGLTPGGSVIGVSWSGHSLQEVQRYRDQLQVEADQRAAKPLAFLQSCPLVPWWGGRDAYLMRGPLGAIHSLGAPEVFTGDTDPLGPMWWWPEDRTWFIGNEIDDAWSYLAGPQTLIDKVLRLSQSGAFEAYPTAFDAPW